MSDIDTLYTRKSRTDKRDKLKHDRAHLSQKGQGSRHKPFARTCGDLLPGVSEVVGRWLVDRAMTTSKTPNLTLMDKLSMIPIRELAQIVLQNAVNAAAGADTSVACYASIGSALHDHLMDKSFKAQHKEAHGWVCAQIKKRKLSPKYQAAFKRKVAAHKDIELEGLSRTERVQAGQMLVELLVRADVLKKNEVITTRRGKVKIVKTVALSDKFLEMAERNKDAIIWFSPIDKPMLKAPNDWHGPWSMVYTDILEPLVKRSEYDEAHMDLLKKADLSATLSAINAVQATPFRVNERVSKVLRWAFENDLGIAGLPTKSLLPLPEKPHDIETNEKARIHYKKTARNTHEANANSTSVRYTVETSLNASDLLKGLKLYFPMQLDFRGRMYSMPTTFQIQGADYVRALLEFHEGKTCDETAMRWLRIHGANLWGFDKVGYDERVQWVHDNWEQVVDVANNPRRNTWWHDADKPWSFLAWCFDVVEAAQGKPSHCRVGLDGSCNGLQHFSGMLRDPVGAAAVNLAPSEKPADIYQQVADLVNRKLKEDKDNKYMADIWRTQVGVDRKMCKRAVMVMPYGGKLTSTMDYVEKEFWSKVDVSPFGDETHKACTYLGKLVYEATREIIVGGKVAMDWLQQAATVASKYNRHIYWTLPHGFVARQKYVKHTPQQIKSKVYREDEGHIWSKIWNPTTQLDKRRSVNGISPNFVHSLDACALMMTVNRCKARGLTSFQMIHDDYSTHAADTQVLFDELRKAFVELYRDHDVLADFRAELCRQLPRRAQAEIPPVPDRGTFEIEQVLDSLYFFG